MELLSLNLGSELVVIDKITHVVNQIGRVIVYCGDISTVLPVVEPATMIDNLLRLLPTTVPIDRGQGTHTVFIVSNKIVKLSSIYKDALTNMAGRWVFNIYVDHYSFPIEVEFNSEEDAKESRDKLENYLPVDSKFIL